MRKDARETAFRILYSRLYNDGDYSPLFEELSKEAKLTDSEKQYALSLIYAVDSHREEIDSAIEELAAKANYRLDRVYATDKCALLLGVAEMTYIKDVPIVVAIDEAVNLCSKYSTKESASFVNGVFAEYKKRLDAKEVKQ